jgi:DNA-binding NarL/FixJ family response regulator
MIRVLIADDHGLVRAGLEQLLNSAADIEVVGSAAGGREAVELAARTSVDVVLMDLSMPDLDGIAATHALLRQSPDARIVMLTSFSDRRRILDAIDAGAVGYLLKDSEPDELLRGIRAAARGESPLAPKAAQQLLADRREPPGPEDQLTNREREILALIGEGQPNKLIARRLQIAEKTVKNHITRILQVLEVTDRTQAALWAQEHGRTFQVER